MLLTSLLYGRLWAYVMSTKPEVRVHVYRNAATEDRTSTVDNMHRKCGEVGMYA